MQLQKMIILLALTVLIINGCKPRETTTVTALDGYIKNAILKDKTGLVATYSGSDGAYVFLKTPQYPLTLTGGTFEDTNAAFDINLTAQSGKVLSPITTFLDGNSTLVEKLANLGLDGNPTAFSDFAVDFIKKNNTDLAKVAQLLYAVETDSNLTQVFKESLITNNSGSLTELFTLAAADTNSTFNVQTASKYLAFYTKVQNLTSKPSQYEIDLQSVKAALSSHTFHSGERWKGKIYKSVTSPFTGRVWLDRNLGALRVCKTFNDAACFGDYYQWGRYADGHQESNSTTTIYLAADINASQENGKYILSTMQPYDWTIVDENGSERSALWSKTDGSSICPAGYRVPTIDEISAETTNAALAVTNNTNAFENFLKLPSAGDRNGADGSLGGQGYEGHLLSTSVSGTYSYILNYNSSGADRDYALRVNGFAVRCVKE
jgi:hypothetical protein